MRSRFGESGWRAVLVGFASCILLSAPVAAHHGGGIEWQDEVVGPLSGVVTEFAFRFPHVQIFFDATDEAGNVERWAVVTRWTPTILRAHGWSRDSAKPGDTISVMYSPHVERAALGQMQSVEINGEALELDFEAP